MNIKKTSWIVIILLTLIAVFFRSGFVLKQGPIEKPSLLKFSYSLGDWQAKDLAYPKWLPNELQAKEFFIRQYANSKKEKLILYAGFFSSRKGTSTHNPDICYPAQGWKIGGKQIINLKINGRIYPVNERIITKGLERQLVIFWYQIGHRTVARKWRHQLLVVKDALLKNTMEASIVRLSMPLGKEPDDKVLETEKKFTRMIIPKLADYLP